SSFARTAPPLVPAAPRADARIRIGYVSADFYDHATLYLMAGLLREHDRSRFEVRAYNYGPGEGSAARAAILPHLDAFVDVRALDDAAAVARIRDDALDIAIDLKGYTKGARAPLFVDRIAPVQIGWLGYPGSLGSDALDYIIGDAVVIPPGAERDYSEQVIRLPGSYQANDDRRAIADAAHTSRATFGLPDEALVLCCFNHPYKIGPREFDLWTRLLHAVPDAVLWLLRPNRWAEANLRREAAARRVDPARLVFADMVPHAEHLARHVHADLFLDTFAVNAHTTASDALWGGVPVLTLAGRQFAARVGASLVTAIGLPELVAQSEAEYEAIALALANDRAALAALRARLEVEAAEMLADGVHLIVVQSADGSLIVGDSHHYAATPPPFAPAAVEARILAAYAECLGTPPPVIERWTGTYAWGARHHLIAAPAPDVRLVVVTSGTGASTAFALAE
ncbi:hypothetical protein LTR94_026222, partial [Friedmanniomyces endolithicus]